MEFSKPTLNLETPRDENKWMTRLQIYTQFRNREQNDKAKAYKFSTGINSDDITDL